MALLLQRRSVEFDSPPRHQPGSVPLGRGRASGRTEQLSEVDLPLKQDAASSSLAGPTKFREHLMSIHRLVLVLNASYEPIHICTARRAITMVLKGAAVVEECSAYTI